MQPDLISDLRALLDRFSRAAASATDGVHRHAALEDLARATAAFVDVHADSLTTALRELPDDLVFAIQRVGRIAARASIERLLHDRNSHDQLRQSSARLLESHPPKSSVDPSALIMDGIYVLLRKLDGGWPEFRTASDLTGYLYRVRENLARNGRRRHGADLDTGDELDRTPSQEPAPPEMVDALDHIRRDAAIVAGIERLPMEQRVLFSLHRRHNLGFTALADLWPADGRSREQRAEDIRKAYRKFIEAGHPPADRSR